MKLSTLALLAALPHIYNGAMVSENNHQAPKVLFSKASYLNRYNHDIIAEEQNKVSYRDENPKSNLLSSNGDKLQLNTSEINNNTPSAVSAQCSQGNYQVSSTAELEQLYQCDNIVGSVHISNYKGSVIDTGSIQTISGDLSVSNASSLVKINVPNLASIGGTFSLKELTSLASISAPSLNSVDSINWKVLPILSTATLDKGIKQIRSITISDTSLTRVSGFDVATLNTLNLNNNRFLDIISMNVTSIKEKLTISANSKNAIALFPELKWANNITIRDISSINLSNMEKVDESMEFISNNFKSLKLPKLESVGGTLSIIENHNLKEVEFNNIDEIGGGLMIVNNTMIESVNFFPKLSSIGGAIELLGSLKEANFSKLRLVKGSAIIQSVYESFDCSLWTKGLGDSGSIVRGGKITCISGSMKHDMNYNENGEILDESITSIENSNKSSNRFRFSNDASAAKANIAIKIFTAIAMTALIQYL
ncbi:hypothetical protein WICMUC_005304 [Wickerhamomyces mucosus]|uniref:Uncharacterized protein n=1 Tax=Wickerhamomyces mucosus TaxID=1378264 RepID=A0A9P8P9A7_9ASCO|nr:hypothetical protein WICMUC_005304 [Wickerhamomyces mucosus]